MQVLVHSSYESLRLTVQDLRARLVVEEAKATAKETTSRLTAGTSELVSVASSIPSESHASVSYQNISSDKAVAALTL